jgi:hypothetical protein
MFDFRMDLLGREIDKSGEDIDEEAFKLIGMLDAGVGGSFVGGLSRGVRLEADR